MGSLTEHGGRIDTALALYPDAPLPWLGRWTGINPTARRPQGDFAIDLRALLCPSELARLDAACGG